ncbi:hypothetical protein MRX96_003301 [Rhipicephalus microplus]
MGTRFIGDLTPISEEYEVSESGPCGVACIGSTMGSFFFVAAGITLAVLLMRNFALDEKINAIIDEEQRLRRLLSLTKSPCNDFYEFVCGRMERELKASASWSPVDQRTLIADGLERRMLLFLEGQPEATVAVTLLQKSLARLGLQEWPLPEQAPVDEKTVTNVTLAVSRSLGLDAFFRLSLAPFSLRGQLRYVYKVQAPTLVVTRCDLQKPRAGPVSRLRALVNGAVQLVAPNSPNSLDAENSAFRVACMLDKVRSLCDGQEWPDSMVFVSAKTLPSVVHTIVDEVTNHAKPSIGVPCRAFVGLLDTVFEPGNL